MIRLRWFFLDNKKRRSFSYVSCFFVFTTMQRLVSCRGNPAQCGRVALKLFHSIYCCSLSKKNLIYCCSLLALYLSLVIEKLCFFFLCFLHSAAIREALLCCRGNHAHRAQAVPKLNALYNLSCCCNFIFSEHHEQVSKKLHFLLSSS